MKWSTFIAYNKRDVKTEMAIQKKLSKFPAPDFLWDMNVRTFNDSNHTTFTTVSFFIGQDSIEFPTREGYLINTDTSTDLLYE